MTAFTPQAQAWTTYWRDCLADIEIRNPANMIGDWELPDDAFRQAVIPDTLTSFIFKKARKARGNKTDDEPAELQVFISPFSVTQLRSHGLAHTDDNIYKPFWIAALLDREGHLHVDPTLGAWFVREHLEPSKEDFPILGTLADFDDFITENDPPKNDDWSKLLEYSKDLFAAVTGSSLQNFIQRKGVRQECRVVLGNSNRGISAKILGLYGAILRDRPDLPLLENIVAPEVPQTAPEPYPGCGPQIPTEHTGQMSSAFPLNPSQRRALHALTQTPEGSALAINGPPGTGKTTLLQSVVASAWVNAAIEGREPPVTLACSSNNQAVTNILDTFAKATETYDEDPLATRWLPGVDSYGLYLPSSGRFKKTDYLAALSGFPAWQGLPERLENEDYVHRASTDYLGHARRALDDPRIHLDGTVEQLSQKIRAGAELLSQAIGAAHKVHLHRTEAHIQGAEQVARHLEAVITAAEDEIQRHSGALADIRSSIARAPWYERALLGFGPTRQWAARQISLRLAEVFHRHGISEPEIDPENFEENIEAHLAELSRPHRTTLDQARLWQRTENDFAAYVRNLPNDEDRKAKLLDAPETIVEALDTGLRRRLFLLTARYYEGRWLLEMRGLLDQDAKLSAQSKEACEARWRRFAKLTPCAVSTFHIAPKVFDYYDPEAGASRPLYNYIDLLIVDEAGQTTPQVAMATFALARRAVVVGDVKQIEPVWELPDYLDHANRRTQGLPVENDSAAEARSVSAGSVMLLAQHATAFTANLGDPGMLLTDHWRCVPEIIEYCNRLAYRGHLIPSRLKLHERILPALGRAHVQSPARRRGSSWINPGEAEAISAWISAQRSELEAFYGGENIEDIVGVVTPFAAQKHVLVETLAAAGLDGLTAGTVHTFQGAERPVIIFSPVYSYSGKGAYFFDRGPNMLNVALSRAKDSFLVVGDLRLFDATNRSLPSGLLGHYLFASEENEIGGIPALPISRKAAVEHLTDLGSHRATLARALNEGLETVLIISPYLRPRVLDADENIELGITSARQRGVEVIVFYNSAFHERTEERAKAEEAAQRLSRAGADVRAMEGIHLKTLAVDRQWLTQGSFNWLSAERSVKRWQNAEASFLYSGEEAGAWIQKIWKEIIDQDFDESPKTVEAPKSAPQKSAPRSDAPEAPPEKGAHLERKQKNGYTHLSLRNLAERHGVGPETLRRRLVELGLAMDTHNKKLELTSAGRLAGGELKHGKYGPFLVWPRDLDLQGDE